MDKNQLDNYKEKLIKDSLLYRLIKYFENNEDRFLRILTAIEEVIYGKDHRQILNALNIVHPHHPDYKKLTGKEIPKSNAKLHTYYNWSIQFHSLFDVPTKFLGFPNDDVVENYLEEHPKIESHMLPLTDFYHNMPKNRKDQIKAYKRLNSKFFKRAKSMLSIYDYISRYKHVKDNPYSNDYFNNAHKSDYSIIENRIRSTDHGVFRYIRILALPPGSPNIEPYHEEYQNEANLLKIKKEICRLISYPLFEHICDTLSYKPYFQNPCIEEEDDYSCISGFYMLPYPTRSCSYSYIYNIEWCLTESYSFTKDGKCLLEMLNVERINDNNEDKVHVFRNEINMIIHGDKSSGVPGAPKFTLEGVPELILDILEEYDLHSHIIEIKKTRKEHLLTFGAGNPVKKELIKKYHKATEALSSQSP